MKKVIDMKKSILSFFAAIGSLGFTALALAAPIAAVDVTDATTSLTNQVTPMTTILTTVLGLVALVMAFGWIRRVMK